MATVGVKGLTDCRSGVSCVGHSAVDR